MPSPELPESLEIIDSHTGGEPTRVVIDGPDLGPGSLEERREIFREHYDGLRAALTSEPRGSEIIVGALLCKPVDPECVTGVIFFNNTGYLNMCGHGTIGVVMTLAELGWLNQGTNRLETPVGAVSFDYAGGNTVTFENVPSYRHSHRITLDVEGCGTITGDVAWGGNWFFIVDWPAEELVPANIDRLTEKTQRIRAALETNNITGDNGATIDHIELTSPSDNPNADSRNFVLCPGGAYDRSPCGTGTSAKIACLIEDGKLAPGETWRQESIIGSVFSAEGRIVDGAVIPRITGEAHITSRATILFPHDDPFLEGLTA